MPEIHWTFMPKLRSSIESRVWATVKTGTHIDRTVYGARRAHGHHLLLHAHHLRLMSLAAVIGAALPVAVWAKARKSHLLSGARLCLMCVCAFVGRGTRDACAL